METRKVILEHKVLYPLLTTIAVAVLLMILVRALLFVYGVHTGGHFTIDIRI